VSPKWTSSRSAWGFLSFTFSALGEFDYESASVFPSFAFSANENSIMSLTNDTSLAKTTDNINRADFFGDKITKRDANEAIRMIASRYLPAWPKNKKIPPEAQPRIFQLTESDVRGRLQTFTGEPVQNAAARMIHSREAARALVVLGDLTGKRVPQADNHCAATRHTAKELPARGKTLF
jgi:hypothetical protein